MTRQCYVSDMPKGCAIATPGPCFGKVVEAVTFDNHNNGYEVVPTRVVSFGDGTTQRFSNWAKLEIDEDTDQRRERLARARNLLSGGPGI